MASTETIVAATMVKHGPSAKAQEHAPSQNGSGQLEPVMAVLETKKGGATPETKPAPIEANGKDAGLHAARPDQAALLAEAPKAGGVDTQEVPVEIVANGTRGLPAEGTETSRGLPAEGTETSRGLPGEGTRDYYQGGYPPQGYPPQGYPPQGYPPQGYPPQGYPPQGYPPQGYPPQQQPHYNTAPVQNYSNQPNHQSYSNQPNFMPNDAYGITHNNNPPGNYNIQQNYNVNNNFGRPPRHNYRPHLPGKAGAALNLGYDATGMLWSLKGIANRLKSMARQIMVLCK